MTVCLVLKSGETMKQSLHCSLLVCVSLICLTLFGGVASAEDGFASKMQGETLLALPLSPQLILDSNDNPVLSVFVRDGSFGQKNVSVVPTVIWGFSDEQEQSLLRLKIGKIKNIATWPDVMFQFIAFYQTSDGEIRTSQLSDPQNLVIGATIPINVELRGLETEDLAYALEQEGGIGIIFVYDVSYDLSGQHVPDLNWFGDFLNDVQDFGQLPVYGAADVVFEELKSKYVGEFGVPMDIFRRSVEKIVLNAPTIVDLDGDYPTMNHNLGISLDIQTPEIKSTVLRARDQFQGVFSFGAICDEIDAAVFVESADGNGVGCDAIK